MLKVFLVIYMAGKIGGTVGPLPSRTTASSPVPSAMEHCLAEALELNRRAHQAVSTGVGADGRKLTEEEMENISSLQFKCEYHVNRPKNEYP